MAKNGTVSQWTVLVNPVIDGMVNSVKNHIFAQTAEFGIQLINNVFVLNLRIGADMHAFKLKNVQEVNILIPLFQNAYVYLDSNGMENVVSSVTKEEFGM